jgi:hypothetical protein
MNLSLNQVIDLAGFNHFGKEEGKKKKFIPIEERIPYNMSSKLSSPKKKKAFANPYPSDLSKFENSLKYNKNDEKDLIDKLSKEFNNPKYKVDNKKNQQIPRSKSYANSILLDNTRTTKDGYNFTENEKIMDNDLDKIRKNNKLLELIVV